MYSIIAHDVKGRIVIAAQDIAKGQLIHSGRILGESPDRNWASSELAPGRHVYLDDPSKVFSHSCSPNMGVKSNEYEAFDFYALVDMPAGTELTYHYGMTESISMAVTQCACGEGNCAGRSMGFLELSPAEQAHLISMGVSDYIRSLYKG